jgi:hypothetical protein
MNGDVSLECEPRSTFRRPGSRKLLLLGDHPDEHYMDESSSILLKSTMIRAAGEYVSRMSKSSKRGMVHYGKVRLRVHQLTKGARWWYVMQSDLQETGDRSSAETSNVRESGARNS